MVVDRTGTFVTLRTLPQLSLIDITIESDHYAVSLPDGPTFPLPWHLTDGPWVRVGVWGDAVLAREHVAAGELLSEWAGVTLRLVCMDEQESVRNLPAGNGQVSFADAFPLLCLSLESVDDVAGRVGSPMDMSRFRPNVVISGGPPFGEDAFGSVRIGEVVFTGASLCSRCVATTIDPSDGSMGTEPLTTLATYRRFGRSVYVGVNLIPTASGSLAVGDGVEILATADLRPPAA
jgi:uncharacterized protein YcbX